MKKISFWDCSCSCGESMGCLDEKMDLVSDFEKRHMDLGHLTSMGRNDFWDVIKK